MISLRQRIRADKILCQPWAVYRGVIREYCVSAKCLFSNKGLPYDILEIELKDEGWLFESEELLDVLRCDDNLLRKHISEFETASTLGDIPDDFTEEDYINFFGG